MIKRGVKPIDCNMLWVKYVWNKENSVEKGMKYRSERYDVLLQEKRRFSLSDKACCFERKGISLRAIRHISFSVPVCPLFLLFLPSFFATKMAETTQNTFGMRSETDFFQRLFLR